VTEHIRDYVHRVEKLSRKIPREMDLLFAITFIKGMKDQERRQRVTFDLKDSPNFSFVKALEVVKFSFEEIGDPITFALSQEHRSQSHQWLPFILPLLLLRLMQLGKPKFLPGCIPEIPLCRLS